MRELCGIFLMVLGGIMITIGSITAGMFFTELTVQVFK